MALITRKVQGGPERLRHFVAENLEALEPGLNVLETSLRLGRSTVDVVAVDGKQTLVLVAVAEVADAAMLISTLDAFIWCLAFPDNMRRLYPDVAIATTRPPRVVLVATQMPAAFLDLAERLSVINPECHELAAVPESEDAPTAGATTAADPTSVVRPTGEPVAELPLAITEVLPSAARLSAGFDAAVSRQWESFLVESPVGGPQQPADSEMPVAESSAPWPPHHLANGTPTGQRSNGHAAHATNGHPAIALDLPGSESEAPIRRSVLAAEPAPVEHAAVNLGVRRPEAPAASAAKPAPSRVVAEPKPATSRPAQEETRTVNHPALQALRFPKSGVSRQWQEFLDQLAANQ